MACKGIAALRRTGDWSDYVIGVAQELIRLGRTIQPLDVAIYSTVPVGSGLSSSASIEVSSALALLFGGEIDKTELAKLMPARGKQFRRCSGRHHGPVRFRIRGTGSRNQDRLPFANPRDCPSPSRGLDRRGEFDGKA